MLNFFRRGERLKKEEAPPPYTPATASTNKSTLQGADFNFVPVNIQVCQPNECIEARGIKSYFYDFEHVWVVKNQLVEIIIGKGCYETQPCDHQVRVNGEIFNMNGYQIYDIVCGNGLILPNHFASYAMSEENENDVFPGEDNCYVFTREEDSNRDEQRTEENIECANDKDKDKDKKEVGEPVITTYYVDMNCFHDECCMHRVWNQDKGYLGIMTGVTVCDRLRVEKFLTGQNKNDTALKEHILSSWIKHHMYNLVKDRKYDKMPNPYDNVKLSSSISSEKCACLGQRENNSIYIVSNNTKVDRDMIAQCRRSKEVYRGAKDFASIMHFETYEVNPHMVGEYVIMNQLKTGTGCLEIGSDLERILDYLFSKENDESDEYYGVKRRTFEYALYSGMFTADEILWLIRQPYYANVYLTSGSRSGTNNLFDVFVSVLFGVKNAWFRQTGSEFERHCFEAECLLQKQNKCNFNNDIKKEMYKSFRDDENEWNKLLHIMHVHDLKVRYDTTNKRRDHKKDAHLPDNFILACANHECLVNVLDYIRTRTSQLESGFKTDDVLYKKLLQLKRDYDTGVIGERNKNFVVSAPIPVPTTKARQINDLSYSSCPDYGYIDFE